MALSQIGAPSDETYFSALQMQPRPWLTLGKHFTAELHSQTSPTPTPQILGRGRWKAMCTGGGSVYVAGPVEKSVSLNN